jgi:hypothetical protein
MRTGGDLPAATEVAVEVPEQRSAVAAAKIGFGVGAAALAAGITLWVLDGQSTVESDAGSASLTPSLGAHGGGLLLHGRW